MEKVLLVTIKIKSKKDTWDMDDSAQELEELAAACGATVLDNVTYFCERPTPNLFIGKGKAEEISLICQQEEVDAVVFSENLSGTQQRNLEEAIGKKTIDRTQLILDIFAQHAKTPEGKMQVELAQLEYLLPRLAGKGVLLSRLGGGIGTRGPGEQKLEIDRRRIRKRIDRLRADLKQVRLHRAVLRKNRKENAVPIVALVGYTNAGKSTLLNALTGAHQTVADSLFTTLDPLSKALTLPNGTKIVLLDTVGFLHELPHQLIEAFKATLEEVVEADLLIHVIDVHAPLLYAYATGVFEVLKELEAESKPLISALNKIDLLDDTSWIESLSKEFPNPIPISAKHSQNIESLLRKIEENFQERMFSGELTVPLTRMDLINVFYNEGKVRKIEYLQEKINVQVAMPQIALKRLLQDNDIVCTSAVK